ncbi:hypothetical protein M942_04625 [Enterobacter ludwigii]|jgi:hypothetical protein|uniref:hypothetical protein n=1 Tax=Enterobacter ludwigii TaxID=299767 RepID=UPI0003D84899|nr:hypothetical protein [Enterobacter ludwigii]AHE72573.1 hypothetical protein M942_04625 [Enterobacter ludwigii]
MSNIDKQALREELSNPAIGSNAHLRKLALALLDELEAAEKRIAELEARKVIIPSVSDDAFWLCHNGRFVFREETYRSAVFKALDLVGIKSAAGTAKGE